MYPKNFIEIGKNIADTKGSCNIYCDGNELITENKNEIFVMFLQNNDIKTGFYDMKKSEALKKLYFTKECDENDIEYMKKLIINSNDVFFHELNKSTVNRIKTASQYVSKDTSREFMQGVLFDKEGKIVATDGRIMYVANGIKEFPECQIRVTKALLEILNKADYIEMGLKYVLNENNVSLPKFVLINFRIGTESYFYSGKLIDSMFPRWRAVVPENQKFHIMPIDKKIFNEIYKTNKKLAPKTGNRLFFTIEDSNHVTVSNKDIGVTYDTINWHVEPDDENSTVFAFNPDFLNTILKSGDLTDIGYTLFYKAFTFTFVDDSYVIAMPMNIKEY